MSTITVVMLGMLLLCLASMALLVWLALRSSALAWFAGLVAVLLACAGYAFSVTSYLGAHSC
jgi:hypothetical protein